MAILKDTLVDINYVWATMGDTSMRRIFKWVYREIILSISFGSLGVYLLLAKKLKYYTVEPLKEDPPRKGHCIKYLSTMDKTKSPNLSLPINIMRLEPLKRGQPL